MDDPERKPMYGTGVLMHPTETGKSAKVHLKFITMWDIEFNNPSKLWVRTDDFCYELRTPNPKYEKYYSGLELKYKMCTLAFQLLRRGQVVGAKEMILEICNAYNCTSKDVHGTAQDFIRHLGEQFASSQFIQHMRKVLENQKTTKEVESHQKTTKEVEPHQKTSNDTLSISSKPKIKPPAIVTPKPAASSKSKPAASAKSKSAASAEPKPAASARPKPAVAEEPKPAAVVQPEPAAVVKSKPQPKPAAGRKVPASIKPNVEPQKINPSEVSYDDKKERISKLVSFMKEKNKIKKQTQSPPYASNVSPFNFINGKNKRNLEVSESTSSTSSSASFDDEDFTFDLNASYDEPDSSASITQQVGESISGIVDDINKYKQLVKKQKVTTTDLITMR